MGRDWSKSRTRAQVNAAKTAELDQARYAYELNGLPAGPGKAELRAQAESAIAAYRGPVRRLPTYAALRCRSCGHRGTARVPVGTEPKFKCSACGSSLVTWHF